MEDDKRLKELLDFFNEETDMGKLYINYPMIESLKYTKQLPDADFHTYRTTLEECRSQFKNKSIAILNSFPLFLYDYLK